MSSASQRTAPSAGGAGDVIARADLCVRELPQRIAFNLRGRADDSGFARAVQATFGLALPAANTFLADDAGVPAMPAANTFGAHDARVLAWLGPDEFLLIGGAADRDPRGMENGFRDCIGGAAAAITAVGAGFVRLEIGGAGARDLLAAGWALDLHPRAFGPGRCAQSHLAKAPVLLLQRDAAPVFEVVVRRSFAGYLRSWLAVSAGTDWATQQAVKA